MSRDGLKHKVRPPQQGRCRMIRYADDFVVCFAYRHAAAAFEKALKERLAKFGLEVAADRTKTLRFGYNAIQYRPCTEVRTLPGSPL